MFLAFDYPIAVLDDGPAQRLERAGPGADADERPVRRRSRPSCGPSACCAEPDATADAADRRCTSTAFGRPPTDDGTADALAFLDEQGDALRHGADDPRAWADLCHVLFNVKEFIFIN